ncbi:hypothetical protein MULP_02407 [Mycobacterium liflandii 128FXT]|uniref:Uncharacterized protein n=1 Tax=Mycobacterium liflandii (strain 128FXT) TaxID=459424 RepID=L7V9Z6_MYCL1|nr:hypothetical protein MULP_02407 [Mycobacterium liflandii 128FXT]MBC9865387.1 hypothetical protein [Mycobacterium pseudoshottsii]BBA88246.1 hypothetical protein MPSD_27340 [Mycobacterium pseudoshottsii JCM 15466]
MSFRNVIGWTVTEYDQPKYIELRGRGRGGVRLAVAMTVAAGHPGSVFHLTADMTGGSARWADWAAGSQNPPIRGAHLGAQPGAVAVAQSDGLA